MREPTYRNETADNDILGPETQIKTRAYTDTN